MRSWINTASKQPLSTAAVDHYVHITLISQVSLTQLSQHLRLANLRCGFLAQQHLQLPAGGLTLLEPLHRVGFGHQPRTGNGDNTQLLGAFCLKHIRQLLRARCLPSPMDEPGRGER